MMKDKIVYAELKTGYEDNGPAWIGKARYSKSGRTIYFNGRAFLKTTQAGKGNYIDVESRDEYWISGVKKNQKDRHWAGSGKVMVDEAVVREYLTVIGETELDLSRYTIVRLGSSDIHERIYEQENKKNGL